VGREKGLLMNALWLAIPVLLALPLFFSTMLFSVVASRVKPAGARTQALRTGAPSDPRHTTTG